MKNILTRNIGLKLLSIVLALLLWLTIMNVEDPSITKTIEGIPVQIIHEEVVTSRGYGYAVESGEKVDVKVKGRRSILDRLTIEDFEATADFTLFNSMYYAPIDVKCKHADAEELTVTPKNDQMAVIIEDQATVAKGIRVNPTGTVKDGYYLFRCEPDTVLVQATGSVSQIDRLSELVVDVPVDGENASFTDNFTLYAVDVEGNRIDSKKITLSQDTVKVAVTIFKKKKQTLKATAVGNPAEYYYADEPTFDPSEIEIAASEEVLSKLPEVLEVECDVSGTTEDVVMQSSLEALLLEKYGEQCRPVSENKTMSIQVKIHKMQEKKLEVTSEDITVIGADSENYEYTLYSFWNAGVTLHGREDDIDNMEISDLNLYVDVTGLAEGTQTVSLKSDYSGGVLVELGSISVIIDRKMPVVQVTPAVTVENDTTVINEQ